MATQIVERRGEAVEIAGLGGNQQIENAAKLRRALEPARFAGDVFGEQALHEAMIQ